MSTLKEKADSILNEKEQKIISENIKNGIQIFDVVGTYTGESSGGIKLYSTISEMNDDVTAQAGDLAIVYNESYSGAREDDFFRKVLFRSSFTLTEPITTETIWIKCNGNKVNPYIDYNIEGNITNSGMYLYITEGGNVIHTVSYGTSDGQIYTRNDGVSVDEYYDIGCKVYFNPYQMTWNDKISEILNVCIGTFEGIYRYIDNTWDLVATQLTAGSSDVLSGKTFYGKDGVVTGSAQIDTSIDISDMVAGWFADNTTFTETASSSSGHKLCEIRVTNTMPQPLKVRDNCWTGFEVYADVVARAIGLTADKIKKGETILGITGTYEG